MYVFELTIPGTWLDYEDRQWTWKIEGLLSHLESLFFEANVALNLFAMSREHIQRPSRESRIAEMDRRSEISREVEQEMGWDWGSIDAIQVETEKRFHREKWSSGQMPQMFERQKPFIYARAFLYALDGFDKFLTVLSKEPGVPDKLIQLSDQVGDAFPDLRMVRNSAQHMEDRARGLGAGKNPKPLDLKPVDNGMVRAPEGALILNCLNGSKYGCTMADGHYGEVEVSPASMETLQQILGSVHACFKWKGPASFRPN